MIRIIDGVAYESSVADSVRLKVFDLGNGHLEASGVRETVWRESDMTPLAVEMYLECLEKYRIEHAEELAEKRLKIAANRAKKNVRRLCKVMGADCIMTLTYRENQTDLRLCKKHLKEFVRRVNRTIKGFRAVCAFEQQGRGAWHVHMAVERISSSLEYQGVKLKSFNVLRAIWRSVVGDLGGTVNLSQGGTKKRSPARIAAYLSKYLIKAFEDWDKGSNRWTRFGDVEVPATLDMGRFPDMRSLIDAAFQLVDGCASVVDKHLSKWGDWFFLVTEGQRCV